MLNGKKIGYIKSIYPTSTNSLTTAEVALNQQLPMPVGSDVTIDVITAKGDGCSIPVTTLVHKKDGEYIMVYKDKRFYPQKVEIILSNELSAIIKPCVNSPIAKANETKLSILGAYKNVNIIGANNE